MSSYLFHTWCGLDFRGECRRRQGISTLLVFVFEVNVRNLVSSTNIRNQIIVYIHVWNLVFSQPSTIYIILEFCSRLNIRIVECWSSISCQQRTSTVQEFSSPFLKFLSPFLKFLNSFLEIPQSEHKWMRSYGWYIYHSVTRPVLLGLSKARILMTNLHSWCVGTIHQTVLDFLKNASFRNLSSAGDYKFGRFSPR